MTRHQYDLGRGPVKKTDNADVKNQAAEAERQRAPAGHETAAVFGMGLLDLAELLALAQD